MKADRERPPGLPDRDLSRRVSAAGVTLDRVSRWVLHVDLDQFIAAVEILRDPRLRGRPVVVGGDGDPTKRGVVATASYEARAFGVHSGLPMRTAARRCPDAVFLPADKPAYETSSAAVMAALREFDAIVEVIGWDEAFLGVVTDDPEGLARRIQRRVKQATELDCTVGIGPNKLQAKLATGFGKPAGVFRLSHATWFEVLGDRPPDTLWGIGVRTSAKLAGLGIRTVRDLAAADGRQLTGVFGPTIGPWLVRVGRGQDGNPVVGSPSVPRSRSRETTFQTDLTDWAEVEREIVHLADRVAEDVASEGRPVVRVVVKVRYRPFTTRTHGQALAEPSGDVEVLEQAALAALAGFAHDRPVRMLGVRAEFPQAVPRRSMNGPSDRGDRRDRSV
jgi:nucleotidyltransferase/DNA polymerase involved in DNA repair